MGEYRNFAKYCDIQIHKNFFMERGNVWQAPIAIGQNELD